MLDEYMIGKLGKDTLVVDEGEQGGSRDVVDSDIVRRRETGASYIGGQW